MVQLPTPDDFIAALDEQDKRLSWVHDRMHWPIPLTPPEFEFANAFLQGIVAAGAELYLPIDSIEMRLIHCFEFDAMRMMPPPASEQEAAALEQKAGEAMGQMIAGLERRWTDEQLPVLLKMFDELDAEDLDAMTDADLAASLRRRFKTVLPDACRIHMLAVLPSYVAVSEFEEAYRRLVEGSTAFDAYALLSGVMNKTVETGHALWNLSRRVPSAVAATIASTPAAAVPAALESTQEGLAFLGELNAYLSEYGHRGDMWGLRFPAWIEQPDPVIENLKDFLSTPEERSPVKEHDALARRRAEAISRARRSLASQPEEARTSFEHMLGVATFALRLTEDHGFYIDFRIGYQMRRAMVAAGRRLAAAGRLDASEQVFGLPTDRICEALENPALQVREEAAAALAKVEAMAGVTPPPILGAPPEAPPENPFTRALGKFVGAGPPQADTGPSEIRGIGGAPGKATGIVRVLGSVAEADKLGEGDVLVAATTAPPWTPVFATVAAVVTDTGGILSHCAVVAREYGIPCVTGTERATSALRDGQRVEVDGDAGVVRVLG